MSNRSAPCTFWWLCSFLLLLVVVGGTAVALDENRISELGWTDAHNVAYGWPVQSATVENPVDFLRQASPEFLCLQNEYGQTALHLAVRQDQLDIVKDVYASRRICLDIPNRDGDTPLHYAAAWGRVEAAEILVAAGADPSSKNLLGRTPRQDAIENKHTRIVSILDRRESEIPSEL